MELFATLLLAHLLADFPLQTDWMFRVKVRHWAGVVLHAAMHVLVTAALIQQPLTYWPVLLILWAVHSLIDWLKLYIQFKYISVGFVLDQIAHTLTLAMIAYQVPAIMGGIQPEIVPWLITWAMIPAVFMFLSILAVDVDQAAPGRVRWSKQNQTFKLISQISGYPLLAAVLIFRLI